MLFNSYTFLVFFIIYLAFFCVFRKKNTVHKIITLIASYIFYSWAYPPYILLLAGSTFVDFWCGKKIDLTDDARKRKFYLIISLVTNLGILGVFKYFNFFMDQIEVIYGDDIMATAGIVLPVGISFYTFQSMSYTIDVYRRKIPYEKSMLDFAVYVSFFPQLVAGPIVFARDFLCQLKQTVVLSWEEFHKGILLILYGFFLKTVIADNLATGVDAFFSAPEKFSSFEALYYCYCYAFQIFGDFAGYSYIAIGIAKILGYHLPRNFDYPYLSTTLTDFWRRWHISLSTWLKEYLYFSLGGNRKGNARTNVNLIVTMLLGGLWHGASWNFVIWGGIHGTGLVIEKKMMKLFPRFYESKNIFVQAVRIAIIFHFVLFAWIFFRSADFAQAFKVLSVIFSSFSLHVNYALESKPIFFIIALIYLAAIFRQKVYDFILQKKVVYSFVILILFHMWLTMGVNSNSFIYFQF